MAGDFGIYDYNRMMFLDAIFNTGKHFSIEQIIDILIEKGFEKGASKANVNKMLDSYKKILGLPISVDKDHKRYYDRESNFGIPTVLKHQETYKNIKIIENLLSTIKDTPVYEDACNVFNQLNLVSKTEELFAKPLQITDSSACSRVIFLGAPPAEVENSVWKDIFTAMESNYYIVITYKSAYNAEEKKHTVKPYQLIFDDGSWKLWGHDCGLRDKTNKLFNLSRIKTITVRSDADSFKLPEDFDFRKITPGTFGTYRDFDGSSPGMVTYKIFLKNYAATYARERIFGMKAKDGSEYFIEAEKFGYKGIIISFDNNQFLPILRWIRGWGEDAIPLEPPILVEGWKKSINAMKENTEK